MDERPEARTNPEASSDTMPEVLREALRDHADGSELAQVWAMLPMAEQSNAERSPASRDALWERIAARTAPDVIDLSAASERRGLTVARGAATSRFSAMRVALLSAAAVLLVSLTWASSNVTRRTEAGETVALRLADGSRVTVGGASEVRYPRWIRPRWLGGGTRQVRLSGVAFFDVAKDAERPFFVETGEASIRVVGTRFNVTSRGAGDEARTEVAVQEGVVEVRAAAAMGVSPAVLRANDRALVPATLRTTPTITSGVDANREGAWIQGGFSAVELTFPALIERLEAQYGVEISLLGSAGQGDAMTVYYPTQRAVDAILLDLCTARGLILRRTSRGFEIAPSR